MREDPNEVYDRIRCRCCGRPWKETIGTDGEVIEGPHPDDVLIGGKSEPLACAIHRPTDLAPAWVGDALARHELAATASNLPSSADDTEVARRELAGGVPTREWTAAGGIPPREFLSAVMARAHEKNGETHA